MYCYDLIHLDILILGHDHDSYHSTSHGGHSAHKECETHYKTIYKTVIEHKKIQHCKDVPKEVCKYIEEEVIL